MRVISDELAWSRTFLAADVFPISFIATDDQGIGQRPEVIMPYVDYFSPMVYPSHYYPGVFDIADPNEHPYEMIDRTLEIMNQQASRSAFGPGSRTSGTGNSGPTPQPMSGPRCRRWRTTGRRVG
jgi:hypothetical protein